MSRENKDRHSTSSHVHGRVYIGEETARVLIYWLNVQHPKKSDTAEKLLRLIQAAEESAEPEEYEQKCKEISAIRRSLHVTFEPDLRGQTWVRGGWKQSSRGMLRQFDLPADTKPWEFYWTPVGNEKIKSDEAHVLVALFKVASQGFISRIRKCARPGCNLWFWARFEHQQFHSKVCQEQCYHASPAWKARRAEYMRNSRLREKERERKEQQLRRRRGQR